MYRVCGKVELVDLLLGVRITAHRLTNQDQEGKRPIVMNGRSQEHAEISERKGNVLLAQAGASPRREDPRNMSPSPY